MIKASVSCDGSHKWAKQKFLKPVDYGFIFWRVIEVVWIIYILGFLLFMMSFSVWYDELKRTMLLHAVLTVFMTSSFIKSISNRIKEKKKILAEAPDGFRRDYIFDETGISLDFGNDEEWGNGFLEYRVISRAEETKDFFIFCFDYKTPYCRVYTIRKNEITEGSAEELTALFQENLGERFRRRGVK